MNQASVFYVLSASFEKPQEAISGISARGPAKTMIDKIEVSAICS